MFQSLQRLVKHSAVYGIGHIITRFLGFLLLPVYTNYYARPEMGVATIMFTYLAILTIIYTYGLDSAFLRFYILEENEHKKKRIFSTAFYTTAVSACCFSALLFFNAEAVARTVFSAQSLALPIRIDTIIQYAAVILFCDALSILAFLVLRAEEKSGWFIFLKFLNVVSNIAFNVLFVIHLRRGIEGIFLSNVLSSAVTLLLLAPVVSRRLIRAYSRGDLRDLLFFGLPYMPSTLSVVILDTIDRPLLERLAGVDVAGLYGTGAKLAMLMALVVAAFRFAWHPFFLSVSKQGDAKQVFSKVLTYVLLVCTALFLFVSLFIDDIVRLRIGGVTLFGPEYWESTAVVPVIMLAYVLNAAYVNFIIGIYLKKKTKYLPFITGAGMIANVLTNILLIPQIGIMGAAWARVLAYAVMTGTLYLVNRRLYTTSYEWKRIFKIIAVGTLLFLAGRHISFAEMLALSADAAAHAELIFRALLLLLFPFLLWTARFFEKAELAKMRHLLKNSSWQH